MLVSKILRYFRNEVMVPYTRSGNLVMFPINISSVIQFDLTSLNIPRPVQVFLPCPWSLGWRYGSKENICGKKTPHLSTPGALWGQKKRRDRGILGISCVNWRRVSETENTLFAGNPFLTLSSDFEIGLNVDEGHQGLKLISREILVKYARNLLLVGLQRMWT